MKGKLTVLMITAFVDMLGLAMVIPLLPFYATKLGASATIVGVLIAAFSVAQLASAPLWGRVSDRYGRRPALLAGLLVSAVAYVIFGYASTLWLLLISRVVQGLGGGTIGVVQAYVADASDPKDRAKSLGWLSAATSFGAVVEAPPSAPRSFTGAVTRPESRLPSSAFSSAFLPGSTCVSRAKKSPPRASTVSFTKQARAPCGALSLAQRSRRSA